MSIILKLFLTFILLGFSALFSASEASYFSLPIIFRRKLELDNSAPAQKAVQLFSKPSQLLIGILIGNMIVNVAATTLITAILLNIFGNAGVGIAIPLMSFLLLIAGEITPKSIAVEYNYTAVKLFALPIQLILTFLSPLIFLFTIFSKFISKKELARSLDRKLNEVDFKTAISLGFSGGFISLPMRESLTRILEMDDIEAADVMAPRAEIPMIDKDFDKREIIEAFKGGAEFVFVYDGSLDNVVGIIPREKLPNIIESFDKNELIEPVLFCAFSTPIKDVISSFRAEGAAYACVVGEHGEILGGITLKNIVDFLFIQPFRTQTGEMEKLTGFVVIPATMTIYEFNGYFKSSLKSELVNTIGGLIEEKTGKIPQSGESVQIENFIFRVAESNEKRIKKIMVQKIW